MAKNMFLRRPVLSTVISILIVILGVLGLVSLPITSYPNIASPMVQVTAQYPGANAEVVLKSVIAPLEEQINGVEGMTYISSSAGNDGSATIKVYFKLGTNPDMAAVNVQNRVSAASSKLPSAVTSYGVTTEKMQNTILLMLAVYSDNPDFDQTFVENYVRINVLPELQRVNGVGRLNVFGAGDYAIRIWLDPDKMSQLNLMPSDITAALQEQNIEAAPGKFGENSDNVAFEYTIKYKGKFTEPSQYEDIVLKAFPDGRILKLKDVARVELGSFNYSVKNSAARKPSISMAAFQMAGSNAQVVVKELLGKMEELSKDFPEGMRWIAPYNTNKFLDASIHHVLQTLFEAFILVFLVVFVFLQDLKSTIIPSISALVALIGTMFCLVLFGFTINMLTLFALVLAIGIVVDDAIVVVEAVHAKLQEGYTSAYEATESAMGEIQGAIISISLVMSAVFIPVSFMTGSTGVFYQQFALTLACSVILSAINALTLSPVMCAIFIKPHHHEGQEKVSFGKRLANSFNAAFDTMTEKYGNVLSLFSKKKIIPVSILAAFGIIAVVLMKSTPTGFIPNEDQGILMVDLTMPAGTSLERTNEVLSEIDSICGTEPLIVDRMSVAGSSLMNDAIGSSYGLLVMSLKDWDEREGITVKDVIGELTQKVSHIRDGKIIFFVPPTVPGFGISSGFEMQLQDKSGGSLEKFYQVQQDYIRKLSEREEIQYASSSFNINFPQYEFDVNVDKCKLAGVRVSDVFSTLQAYYGSSIVSDFNRFNKYYRVLIQAAPENRESLISINAVKVRNSSGEMVPISTLVDFKRVYGPELLNRYNLYTSTAVTGAPAPGYSTGDAIRAIREVAEEELPTGYGYDFSGITREEIESSGQQGIIFLLCFIFVFLILSAQYESYIIPWSVLISLLIGVAGVYIFINIFGIESNIYVQVALIMLIGLLAKNGILIVEFAKQRYDSGMPVVEAAISGAKARLRPILMTSFAFIFGLIPLCTSSGAGAVGNISIGIAAVGGMFIGTLFGVFIIPVMYIIFQNLESKLSKKRV
ncbi:MAG: efflux RND transporter permease subunit [Bacteroidales bacterium]|nr:efflux RND transporter permease subunit [Bacteroidales bacterium]